MSRRAHGAEGVLDLTRHHQIDRQDAGAGGAQRRLPGVPVHGRVRIEVDDAQLSGEARFSRSRCAADARA
jgi:hypothetical protein